MERKLRQVWEQHQDLIKKWALPVVAAVALVGFWVFGGNEEPLSITEDDWESGAEIEREAVDMAAQEQQPADAIYYVDIGGEVVHPGVYPVEAGTRLFQVVEAAGGLLDSADIDSINQAEMVSDGQKIIIGSRDPDSLYFSGSSGYAMSGGGPVSTGQSAVRQTETGVVVSLNRATSSELQQVPGIGPATAQKIIDYRNQYGDFTDISQIKNISGIGDKTYDTMKEFIEL